MTGATNLLARARSFHNLALMLAAILAWPTNISLLARDVAGASRVMPADVLRPVGACFRGHDRRTDIDRGDWSMIVGDLEEADGGDDIRYAPLAIPHRPTDLPSLVPCPLETRTPNPANPGTPFRLAPPLRC